MCQYLNPVARVQIALAAARPALEHTISLDGVHTAT